MSSAYIGHRSTSAVPCWRATAWPLGSPRLVVPSSEALVEAVFEGQEDAVDRMVAWARRGPPHAAVERIETLAEEPDGLTSFSIR